MRRRPSWSRGAPPNDKNPQAAPANPAKPGGDREAPGRSRGGLSTKVHLAADRRCRPVTRILTPGQHGDCPQFIPLLEQVRIARRGKGRPRIRPGTAMAGKAYSSAANRAWLRRRGIAAVIPVKEDQKQHRRARGRAAADRLPLTPHGTRSATPSARSSPPAARPLVPTRIHQLARLRPDLGQPGALAGHAIGFLGSEAGATPGGRRRSHDQMRDQKGGNR